MLALQTNLTNVPMVFVLQTLAHATTLLVTLLVLLVQSYVQMGHAVQLVNAHSLTVALLALHSNAFLVTVLTPPLQPAQWPAVLLVLLLNVSMVSVLRASSTALPPSLMKT